MRIDKHRLFLAAATLLLATSIHAAPKGQEIKKCKDAKGTWHYGDNAAAACGQTKITVINDRGIKVNEVAAPLTAEERKQQERSNADAQAERKRQEDAVRRDQQLLASYGHEDDIIRARDRKLADIQAQMYAIESTLNTLRATLERMQARSEQQARGEAISEQAAQNIAKTEAQIAKQEAAMENRKKEQETLSQQYAKDIARFRELQGTTVKTGTETLPAQ